MALLAIFLFYFVLDFFDEANLANAFLVDCSRF